MASTSYPLNGDCFLDRTGAGEGNYTSGCNLACFQSIAVHILTSLETLEHPNGTSKHPKFTVIHPVDCIPRRN